MVTDSDIREALRQVVDPELGVNIVDLGLVYRIDLTAGHLRVEMTMTSPACPLRDYLTDLVAAAVEERVPEALTVEVVVVTDPPWSPERMSDEARQQLGDFGR